MAARLQRPFVAAATEDFGPHRGSRPTWVRRNRAVATVESFKAALAGAHGASAVRSAADRVWAELVALQGAADDQPHLAKSLCQVATAVRRRGFPGVASGLLEWMLDAGLADAYVVNELLLSYVLLDDLDAADRGLAKARARRLATPGIYSTLIAACGRLKNTSRARQLFEQALADGLVDGCVYTAIISVYGKAGALAAARAVFEQARARGLVLPGSYTALVVACAQSADLASAQHVFAEAQAVGLADQRTYTALLGAYGKAGDVTRAQRVFDQAHSAGLCDSFMYTALITAHASTGAIKAARRTFDAADAAGLTDVHSFKALILAYARAGDRRNVRRLFKRARQRGMPSAMLRLARQEAYRSRQRPLSRS